jgi:transposase
MNILLNVVLSDIAGVTGLAILRAIVAGERDPALLAELRNPGCKASLSDITKALTGNWQQAELFILQQSLEIFDYYTAKIAACDAELERQYREMKSRGEEDTPCPICRRPSLDRSRRTSRVLMFEHRWRVSWELTWWQ